MSPQQRQLDDPEAVAAAASDAAEHLKAGELVVVPTETVYGIAADVRRPEAVDRLRKFKQRPDDQALTVHLANPTEISRYADPDRPGLKKLARKLMPGPVTVVVPVSDDEQRARWDDLGLTEATASAVYGAGEVALRCPDDPVAQRVLAKVGGPVVITSANRPGDKPAREADQAREAVGDEAALVIDAGPTRYARPSTVVRIDDGKVKIEREGVYDERTIRRTLRTTYLLVCSGNTCRSPMAEAIAKELLAKRADIDPGELEAHDLRVVSAGVYAGPGAPATAEAVEAIGDRGGGLREHRSQPVTPQLLREADKVWCMTAAHEAALRQSAGDLAGNVERLDPDADIQDPVGGSQAVYDRTAAQIEQALVRRLDGA
ncbi:MAG: L-threonylcarbamoyladenylate synthase [Phycisphaeraceae bacterium]|nr:L-threonylcarbamoyladenylate synthase [Phycisphaeraceae bacterium]